MMNNNVMVQELTDSQLDMITGGGFFDEIKGIASKAWKVTKSVAGMAADTLGDIADKTAEAVKAIYLYRETR